jgi:hypothetical protein
LHFAAMSKSEAIGNSAVIPAPDKVTRGQAAAGIQGLLHCAAMSKSEAIGNSAVIPAPDKGTRGQAAAGIE